MEVPGRLPTKQPVPDNLRAGQLVQAQVLGPQEPGVYRLRIRGQVVQVRSTQPLATGQRLRLEVLGPEGFVRADTPPASGGDAGPTRPGPISGAAAQALARYQLPLTPALIEQLQRLGRSDPAAIEGGAFMLARGLQVGPELAAMLGELIAGNSTIALEQLLAPLAGRAPAALIAQLIELFPAGQAPQLATLQQALALTEQLSAQLAAQMRQTLTASPALRALGPLVGLFELLPSHPLPADAIAQLGALLQPAGSAEAALPQLLRLLTDQPALARYLLGGLAASSERALLARLAETGSLPEHQAARLLRRLRALVEPLTAENGSLRRMAAGLRGAGAAGAAAEQLALLARGTPDAALRQLEGLLLLADRDTALRLGDALATAQRQLIEQLPGLDPLRAAQDALRSLQVRWQAQTLLPALPDPGSIMLTTLDLPVTPGGPFRRGQFQLLLRRDARGRLRSDRPRTLYVDVELTRLGRVEALGTVTPQTAELTFLLDGAEQASFLGEQLETLREALGGLGLTAAVTSTVRATENARPRPIETGTQSTEDVEGIDVLA